ncbi:MAG: hypothetical protein AAFQ71_15115, partial [Planctomycetota bacterium]
MHRTAQAVVALIATVASAQLGPINPPAGPVGDTGPDLSQIDGRTPLSAETTPGDGNSVFRIAASGSYYLTQDLVVPSGRSGIEVAIPNVNIDLNGFSIRGSSGSLDGVDADGRERIRVANGTILGMGRNGVIVDNEFLVENLIIRSIIGGDAISVNALGIVRNCIVNSVSGTGNHAVFVDNCCVDIVDCRFGSVGDYAVFTDGGASVERCHFNNSALGAFRSVTQSSFVGNTVEYVFGTVPSVVVGSDSIVRDNYIDSGGGFGVDITSTR